ncbi:MAG: 50S ribosomal protein L15 [Actinomycetota bacterium]
MVLKVHHLRPAPGAKKAKTRKGRGEASKGKTAGRGGKGTHARNTVRAGFEGGQMPLVQRLPKMRGFKNPERIEFQAVNVATINEAFPNGGNVTVDSLVKAGLARKGHLIKVLGQGDISVKVSVEAHAFSKSAEEKIAAAGGSVKTV